MEEEINRILAIMWRQSVRDAIHKTCRRSTMRCSQSQLLRSWVADELRH